MTVQEMSLYELVKTVLDNKSLADNYYKKTKEAERELQRRYEIGELNGE